MKQKFKDVTPITGFLNKMLVTFLEEFSYFKVTNENVGWTDSYGHIRNEDKGLGILKMSNFVTWNVRSLAAVFARNCVEFFKFEREQINVAGIVETNQNHKGLGCTEDYVFV